MKKILVILGVVVVVVAAAYYLYPRGQSVPTGTTPITTATSSAPVPLPGFSFTASDNDGSGSATSTNGITVSLRPSPPYDAQNQVFSIFVNNKQVGPAGIIAGTMVSRLGFSPNDNYFAFRMLAVTGAYRYNTDIGIVDLIDDQYSDIQPKVQATQYSSSGIEFWDLSPYISFYKWSGSSTLDVTSYVLGTDYNETSNTLAYYRMSPTETWRYDLTTGSSTLIQTTP